MPRRSGEISEDEWHVRIFVAASIVLLILLGSRLRHRASWRLEARGPLVVSAPVPRKTALVTATIAPHRVSLTGRVPTEAARKGIVAVAKGHFPTADVDDDLSVDPLSMAPSWAQAFSEALGRSSRLRWGSVSIDGRALVVEGELTTEEAAQTLRRGLLAQRAEGLTVPAPLIAVRPPPRTDADVIEMVLAARLDGPLTFPRGEASLDERARAQLDLLALDMDRLARLDVEIHVYAHGAEPFDAALPLAEQRARAIQAHLVTRGVPGERLHARGLRSPPEAPPRSPPEKVAVRAEFVVREVR